MKWSNEVIHYKASCLIGIDLKPDALDDLMSWLRYCNEEFDGVKNIDAAIQDWPGAKKVKDYDHE